MSSTTIELNIEPTSLELGAPAAIEIELGAVLGPPGPAGPAGPAGPQGVQGEPGLAGSAPQAFEHEQSVASATWTITHNLGYRPAGILVFDTAGSEWVPGVIIHSSINELVIQWSAPFSGTAYLS